MQSLHVSLLSETQELVEAQKLLEKIKSFEERTFQCLVYYAIGRVYVKENRYSSFQCEKVGITDSDLFLYQSVQYMHLFSSDRFTVALKKFSDSLQMVKNQITPGKLTWPLTKEVVKETQSDYFKVRCHSNSYLFFYY